MGRLIQCQTLSHTFLNCFCTKNGEFGIGWQGPSGGDPPGLHQVRLKELLDILGNVLGTALVLAEEAEHPQGDVSAAPSMSQMLSRLSESPTPKSSVSLHKHPFNFYFFFLFTPSVSLLCAAHTLAAGTSAVTELNSFIILAFPSQQEMLLKKRCHLLF